MPQARVYDELDETELDQLARLLQQQRKEMDCENALLMDASRTLRR